MAYKKGQKAYTNDATDTQKHLYDPDSLVQWTYINRKTKNKFYSSVICSTVHWLECAYLSVAM